jgi:hypothetical protein
LWRILLAVGLYELAAVDIVRGATRGNINIVATGVLLIGIFLIAANFRGIRSRLPLLGARGTAYVIGWVSVAVITLAILAILPESAPGMTSSASVVGYRIGVGTVGAVAIFVNNWMFTGPIYIVLATLAVVVFRAAGGLTGNRHISEVPPLP